MKTLLARSAVLLALAPFLGTIAAEKTGSGATARYNPEQSHMVEIRNERLSLVINLERGAHVIHCTYKGFDDQDIVFDWKMSNGGLFKDLWYTQGWPGEFDRRTYECEIVSAGPDEAVVKTWTMSTGVFKKRKLPDLADLLLVKTFRLRQGSLHLLLTLSGLLALRFPAKLSRAPPAGSQASPRLGTRGDHH